MREIAPNSHHYPRLRQTRTVIQDCAKRAQLFWGCRPERGVLDGVDAGIEGCQAPVSFAWRATLKLRVLRACLLFPCLSWGDVAIIGVQTLGFGRYGADYAIASRLGPVRVNKTALFGQAGSLRRSGLRKPC